MSKISLRNKPPIVEEMTHTSDYTAFIEPYLHKLSGHRDFGQFKIRKENERVSMYVKSSELDEEWKYPRGIKMFKEVPILSKISVSPFRENTDYSSIFSSVDRKYFPSLNWRFSEEEVQEIHSQWEARIKFLIESRPPNFEAFNLGDLKKYRKRIGCVSTLSGPKVNPVITAVFHPITVGALDPNTIQKDATVILYATVKSSRPWAAIVIEVKETTLLVHWLKKEKKFFTPEFNADGSPRTSEVPVEAVMFADALLNSSNILDVNGPYTLDPDMRRQIMIMSHATAL